MANMFVRGTVGNYALFKDTFDSEDEMRRAAGSTGNAVYQSADDPNEITIRADFPSIDEAKAFASSEGLKEAMKRGGVTGPPTIWFVNQT
jgi:hypothetical protein